jgi:cyclophilin family peptidyl-prolyl cis-trans isomerase
MAELRRAQQRRRRYRVAAVGAVLVVIAVVLIFVTSGGGGKKGKTSVKTTTSSTTTVPSSSTTAKATTVAKLPTAAPVPGGTLTTATTCPTASSARITTFKAAPPNCLVAGKTYTATFVTNEGTVVVKLDTTKTPETANNFIVLAGYHFYDGTAMFRTDTSIGIIQGGSPKTQSNADPGPGYTIKDEGSKYTYAIGDLVMARTSAANSAGAQYFFCVTAACSELNSQGTYVVFGTTTSGLDVLQKILALNTTDAAGDSGPSQLVTVKSVTITES